MPSYRDELEAWAAAAGSDGCSIVPEFYRVCCLEHDHAYQTGRTLHGVPMSKAQADQRFRDCIQAHSSFRWLSPLSWWRYWAVSLFGRGIWSADVAELYAGSPAQEEAADVRQRILAELFPQRVT